MNATIMRSRRLPPSSSSLIPSLLLFVILSVSLLPSSSALQVSPAAKSITLADGGGQPSTIAYTLRVINDDHARLAVNLSATGGLAGSVLLSPSSFTFSSEQAEQPVTVTVTPPQDLAALAPGDHLVTISVSALPAASGGQFGSGVTLLHNLALLKPYAGAYLVGSLSAEERGNGTIAFTLSLSNKGDAATAASGTVSVTGPGGLSGSAALASSSITGLFDGKLTGSWSPVAAPPSPPSPSSPSSLFFSSSPSSQSSQSSLVPGHYVANATVSYDDPARGTVRDSYAAAFLVGHPSVRLAAISPALAAGAINRVFLPEEMAWDAPVDAYADVSLVDGTGVTVATTRTSTATLSPSSPGALLAFLDLPSLPAGNYSLRATVRDAQGSVMGNGEWAVQVSSAAATPLAAAKAAVSSPPGAALLITLIILLLTATALFLRRRRR